MLMEMNVFQALGEVLGLYANIAIAWMMAVVADLVINKPLGLSPKGIEFKRAHLYDINPVGVGAMVLASGLSIAAYLGLLGETAKAFSAMVAMVTALVTAPLIAWLTRGKYYACAQFAGLRGGWRAGRDHPPLRDLRARLRRPGHGLLPGLPEALFARCAARWTRAAATPASPTPACRAQWSASAALAAAQSRCGRTWRRGWATSC